MRAPPTRFGLVLACFFVSGLAALIYQTAWTRQLAFVFGTSQLAVATVLAAYMGGLALGAAAAARLAPRIRRPVLAYGLLELAIALSALLVPAGIALARRLYVAAFTSAGGPPGEGGLASALFYLACSFAVLLVPTAFMGATLPLLARYAVRRESEIGPRVGLLYATNTAGAVLGTLLAGFVLLPALGLTRTIWVAVAGNALVFAIAALLARGVGPAGGGDAVAAASVGRSRRAVILPLIAVSGVCSFAYEVLWTRVLETLIGASVYAFATMLASFLTGIALGAAAAAPLASDARRAGGGFALAQLGTAALFSIAYLVLDALPQALAGSDARGGARLLLHAAAAAGLLLPGTVCIGATFPFAVRVLARDGVDAGPASARVYAWNTVGAIVGAVGAGFFLLPLLGYSGLVAAAAAVNCALALGAASLLPWRRPVLAGVATAAALGIVWLQPGPPWALLRSTGSAGATRGEIVHYGVGRSATVVLTDEGGFWKLLSNGLLESSIHPPGGRLSGGDLFGWLGALHVLARPEARSMLMVGLGGGGALESVPRSIERIDVVEIEPEIVAANRVVAPWRARDPLADPRVRIVTNDARGALLLTPRAYYGAIVSQPSHPWTAGASHLYTREFFELARTRLAPGGVLVQWIGVGFVDEALVRTVVSTLLDVFRHVRLYQPTRGTLFFVASDGPLAVEEAVPRAVAADPDTFARIGIHGAADVAAALLLTEEGARAFAAGAPSNTDDRNLLQMRAPHIVLEARPPWDPTPALALFDPLAAPTLPWSRTQLVRRLLARGFVERARRVADAAQDPTERAIATGLVQLRSGLPDTGRRQLERVAAEWPDRAEAQVPLLRMRRAALVDAAAAPGDLDAELAALVEGWRLAARGDWDGLRALDARLARIGPAHPAFGDASSLRARWRVEAGVAERASEALELLERALPVAGYGADEVLLKARAAGAAGHATAALALVDAVLPGLRGSAARPRARDALALVRSLPEGGGAGETAERRRLLAALEPLAR